MACAERNPVAAIFCVWDATTAYYLMSTRDAEAGNGAISLLLWHAIQSASQNGLVFDMDGISHKGHIHLYAGFGGRVTPRYVISKAILPVRIAREFSLIYGGPSTYY